MEDPTEECEIEEESYYSEHSPQVDYSTGKVSWILNKGWGIGKKLLMTGAVISSAPFVLPPLVVTSAIVFACWVPCGVVMASYTCSEKFMSKLLPYNSNEDEVEFEDAEEDVKVDVGEYLDMEEKPLLEGLNGARMEGSRYEYNDDVLLDENAISDGVDLVVFNVIEDGEEFGVSPIEVTSVRLEGSEAQEKVSDLLEEEELVKETRGLLEKIRDEGSADDGMEMENHYSDGTPGSRKDSMDILLDNNVVSDEVDIYVSNVIDGEEEIIIEEPEEKEIVNDFMEDEELVKERGLLEKMRDAGSADNGAVAISEPYAGVIEQGEEEMDEITNSNFEETERAVDKTSTDISQVTFPSINEKENVVSANGDARKIADESGLYVFDENNASGNVGGEGADFAELSISTRVSESTDAKISSQKDNIHSNGVRDLIHAIRT